MSHVCVATSFVYHANKSVILEGGMVTGEIVESERNEDSNMSRATYLDNRFWEHGGADADS